MIISHCCLHFEHQPLLENFTFELPLNQWTSFLGPSGIGKSSLLKIMAGLLKPDSGQVISSLGVSYMSQDDALLPWLSLLDNVLLGYTLRKTSREKTQAVKEKALALLEHVGLSHAVHLKPAVLSGGMRQRAALVRTLLEENPIVLMDEPFTSLDVPTRLNLHHIAWDLLKHNTVLLVTHDPLDALRLSDNIHVLQGTPMKLSSTIHLHTPKPRNPGTPEFMQYYSSLLNLLSQSLPQKDTLQ